MIPVIINSMVAGVIFCAAYQFLFIGLKNRKHPEYLIFGIIVLLQAICTLIELFNLLSDFQSVYLSCRFTYFAITAVINLLFFFFISFVSNFRHTVLKWIYVLFVLSTLILNNTTLYIAFINHSHYSQAQLADLRFFRLWTVPVCLIFGFANSLQFIILAIFSILAYRFQLTRKRKYANFIVYSLSFFIFGSLSDLMVDFGIIHFQVSSFFYLIIIIYVSTNLYRNIERAKQFKDEAYQGEMQLRQIIDLVPNLIFVKDIDGRFILANKALADIYGTTTDNLKGRTHEDYFHIPGEGEFFRQKDLEVSNSGEIIVIPEEKITDINGNTKILQTIKIPFSHTGSKAILGVSTDITALKESEIGLKNNEQLLSTIFENASVAMLLIDNKSNVLKINKAAVELGLNLNNEVTVPQPYDALNCIVANSNDQRCVNKNECSECRLYLSVQSTFEKRTSINKVPFKMSVNRENVDNYTNLLLSTSYLEINNTPLVLLVLEDITSMMNVERALMDSEFRYRQITRAITDYIYTAIIHENGEIQTIQTSACFFITGYRAEEFEADPSLWFAIIQEDDREEVLSFVRNQNSSSEKQDIEYRIIHKDGGIRWVSNTLVKKKRKSGLNQYDGIIKDITKRKSVEEALDNQNKLLNTMLDNLPIGIFMVNVLDGTPLIANEQAKKLLAQGILPDVDLTNIADVYKAFKAGTDQPYPTKEIPIIMGMKGEYGHIDDLEVEHPDGTRTLLEIVGCPVYDTNNNIWASLVGFYDITARKNAEHALRESEKKLSIVFEYAQVGISLIDKNGYIQYMNPAFYKILNNQQDQIIDNNFRLFTGSNLNDEEMKLFDQLEKGQLSIINIEKKYIQKQGEELYVRMQVSCFKNRKGETENFITVVEDITERKKAIDSLQQSEEKLRNIFNSSNDAILITDFESHILEANRITLSRSGYAFEQIKNKSLINLFIAPEDQEEARNQFSNLVQNKTAIFHSNYINQRGEKIYIEVIGHPINYNGKQLALLVSRNITERVLLQQKILNAIIEAEEKERSFFARELHDGLGPILSTVKLYLEWIQNPEAKSDKSILLTDALSTIEEAIVSIKEISNRLSPNVLTKFGLDTAIQSFVKKIECLGKVHFSVSINLTAERILPEIEAMLYRVFVEAINNTLKYANASNIVIQIYSDAQGLSAVICDDGIGFDLDKTMLEKTGHGLFNMQNRVETYEGNFSLKSIPGIGTEIKITIPLHKYMITNK